MPLDLLIDQTELPGLCSISDAVERLAYACDATQRGAVFTRIEVVNFMLDLAGYTPERKLFCMRLLEPSFGGGEFVLAAATRLIAAFRANGSAIQLDDCIRAVELHSPTFETTKNKLHALLLTSGFSAADSERLASKWLLQGDFLLTPLEGHFDFVVGNPPYVRQEQIPAALLTEYRRRYATLFDRADLYIPFIERSLSVLNDGGEMALICADRWTKNKYGGPLRAVVDKDFHLRAYVDMVDTPAFDSDVVAYPAITLIERAKPGPTWVAQRPRIEAKNLATLAVALRTGMPTVCVNIRKVERAVSGSEPWLFSETNKLALLRRIEERFPLLEDAGCKVGIGVATGADKAFIAPFATLDVEPSRKVPLATTRDIATGTVSWQGLSVINPFEDDGSLVDLAKYPKLKAHLETHRNVIAGRHVARKSPANWYRTIDRITLSLASKRKLLIPDIKGKAQVVYEDGKLYPHHNLYFIVSGTWDLRALQAVLLSSVTRQFIQAYSTAMRGGFLRFQAQYLRRIRLPLWESIDELMRARLIDAAIRLDLPMCDAATAELYGLTDDEFGLLAS